LDDGAIEDVPLRFTAGVLNGIAVCGHGTLATCTHVVCGVAVENHEFIERIAVYDEPAAATGDVEPVAWEIQAVVRRKGQIDVDIHGYVWDDTGSIATAGQGEAGERQ